MVDVDDIAPQSRAPGLLAAQSMLLVRAGEWIVALPITDIIETMRALPVRPIAGAPPFVRGVSIIRGAPLPVVDLSALMGGAQGDRGERGGRYVTARAGARAIALHVDEVIGARVIDRATLSPTPPLLSEALPEHAEKLFALDGEVIATLRAGRVLSKDVWSKLLSEGDV